MDMKHIITDEEAKEVWSKWNALGTTVSALKRVLADFLANRPQVAQLRPIAEMPETVPEGCERLYWSPDSGWWINPNEYVTHATDIQLPTSDPEAEMRQEFEEAMKSRWSLMEYRFANGSYDTPVVDAAFAGFKAGKLAKKGGDK